MDFATLVRSRLSALGYEQKDLARAVRVTDSYVSQLLNRRKVPPGPERTDIYPKMEAYLKLRPGELTRLVEIERNEEIRRKLEGPPEPLFRDFRELVLRKCVAEERSAVRLHFEVEPFGPIEQLVTRKLLQVVQSVARSELDSKNWTRLAGLFAARSHEEMRVLVLEFLDTDVLAVSNENCLAFLEPLVDSWSVQFETLQLDIWLDPDFVRDPHRRFALVECDLRESQDMEPGLAELVADPALDCRMTEAELKVLRGQRFTDQRPTKLYFYRALQNLRDPLHFEPVDTHPA
jgi:transcriptional regulator with XRE-family HTH domain